MSQQTELPNNLNYLLETMDGATWAKEFCRVTGFADEAWALTWFCNAIMAGFDEANRRQEAASSGVSPSSDVVQGLPAPRHMMAGPESLPKPSVPNGGDSGVSASPSRLSEAVLRKVFAAGMMEACDHPLTDEWVDLAFETWKKRHGEDVLTLLTDAAKETT